MNNSKWVYEGKPVHCSICGYEPTYSLNNENSKYCPCCGTLMRQPLNASELKKYLIEYLIDIKVQSDDKLRDLPKWDTEFKATLAERKRLVQEVINHMSTIEVEE